MNTHAQLAHTQLERAGQLDKELKARLKAESPFATQVLAVRKDLRKAYEDVLFQDYIYAQKYDVDTALWMKLHHRTIEAFRSRIAKSAAKEGPDRPVEHRKLITHFVDFLKESAKFYKGLAMRLITHFGVKELYYVLQMLDVEIPKLDAKQCSTETRELVKKSCHAIFIHLGDLSRYRELQSVTKNGEKNWGPALGYYQFARRLLPTAGTPMNQLAVVTIYTGDTFASSYYFLRASCAIEPFPTATENLALGFKKVLKKPAVQNITSADAFMRLLASSFAAPDAEIDSNGTLKQLQTAIVERNIACETLTRLVCSVIAVHYLKPTPMHLKLLLDTMQMLLETLLTELGIMADLGGELATRVSAVVRRMLPALRLLTRWLFLNLETGRSVWNRTVHVMTVCGSKFPRHLLPSVQPLPEDLDMRGFAPLDGGLRASAMSDVQLQENEVLLRLAALLADAADIAAAIQDALAPRVHKRERSLARDSTFHAMNQMVDNLVT
jgi:hypothetical protein